MAMMTRFLNRGSPSLLRRGFDFLQQPQSQSLRRLSSARSDDELREPCEFLGSWSPPSDPRIARANLERLRRAYGKQVKQMRKEYIYEVEMLRIDKQRKADARREAMRIENEERKKAKAAAAETRAAEHKAFQKEFRKTLVVITRLKLKSFRATEMERELSV
ncbi:stress response NST1-like protein isoform X2 [Carex rostrata]